MSGRRIAAVVINSVHHDARVLREADSLAAAGYEVAVFGIQDNRCSIPLSVRESGAQVHLCEWKHRVHLLAARIMLLSGLITTLAALLVHATLRKHIHAFVTSRAFVEFISVAWVAAIAGVFAFYYLQQRRAAQRAGAGATAPGIGHASQNSPAGNKGTHEDLRSSLVRKIKNLITRWAMQQQLARELRPFQPDVVHCHDLNALPVGWAHKKRTGCLVVFDSHELYEEQSMATPWQKRVYQRRQRFYSDKVDAFITINDSIADYLRKGYPSLPDAVIVKNATRLPQRQVEYDGRLHRAAKLDRKAKILLYQGGFAQFRGLEALVRSGPLLPHDWVLVMMGWGKHEAHLRAIARKVDAKAEKIRFLPGAPHAELAEWTAGGALGVIPYENVCLNHWFCTPNKLWEYPVAGVPILASPFPEMEKVVATHDIGLLLADPATPQNIAAGVASVTDAHLERMRRNCRTYLERDNWALYESRLVGVYDGLLRRESRAQAAPMAPSLPEPKVVVAKTELHSIPR